jgi:hypothetical protein
MSKPKLCYLLSFFFCLFSSALGGIINVPQDQPSIQAGINAATNGDTVLVQDNTYYENINFLGKVITVASHYIMDGDTNHIDGTIINGSQPSNQDSGSVVSFTSGEDTTSVIYGFTITGGTGTLYNSQTRVGGGIYCKNSGARIAHNKIVHNSITHNQDCDGGAICTWPRENVHHVVIEDNLIESNSLNAVNGANGGGIFLVQGRIICNTIYNNVSHSQSGFATGGGISANCGEIANRTLVKVIDNEITNNQAISDQYVYSAGGGVDIVWCNIELVGNVITHNLVSGLELVMGGGARLWGPRDIGLVKNNIISFNLGTDGECYGGGMDVAHCSNIIVQGNQFEGNIGSDGGALVSGHNTVCVISDNDFIENTSDWGGGLCEYDNIQQTVMNNLFHQNTALYSGGGNYSGDSDLLFANNILSKNESRRGGGAAFEDLPWYAVPCRACIINNTFTENIADTAGAISILDTEVLLMNTICWGNSAPRGPEIEMWGGILYAAYSDIQFGLDSIAIDAPATINWVDGNISKEPMLRGDPLVLSDSSSCIGAGTLSYTFGSTIINCPSTCFLGNPRPSPSGTLPDMGACESALPSPVVSLANPLSEVTPKSYELKQNYPNPFNPTTTIEFTLPQTGYMTLKIFNILGEEVATLVSEKLAAGSYKYNWNATGLAGGIYLYRLESRGIIDMKKMILLK